MSFSISIGNNFDLSLLRIGPKPTYTDRYRGSSRYPDSSYADSVYVSFEDLLVPKIRNPRIFRTLCIFITVSTYVKIQVTQSAMNTKFEQVEDPLYSYC